MSNCIKPQARSFATADATIKQIDIARDVGKDRIELGRHGRNNRDKSEPVVARVRSQCRELSSLTDDDGASSSRLDSPFKKMEPDR